MTVKEGWIIYQFSIIGSFLLALAWLFDQVLIENLKDKEEEKKEQLVSFRWLRSQVEDARASAFEKHHDYLDENRGASYKNVIDAYALKGVLTVNLLSLAEQIVFPDKNSPKEAQAQMDLKIFNLKRLQKADELDSLIWVTTIVDSFYLDKFNEINMASQYQPKRVNDKIKRYRWLALFFFGLGIFFVTLQKISTTIDLDKVIYPDQNKKNKNPAKNSGDSQNSNVTC